MNITELRYLVAIMKWGSVSAAAKQMYAAQPNVSKALKNLEEEYGIRMFERSSTGMIPTEQGRHFIEQAQRVLQHVAIYPASHYVTTKEKMERAVQEIDPDAFVIVCDAHEILGEGFGVYAPGGL